MLWFFCLHCQFLCERAEFVLWKTKENRNTALTGNHATSNVKSSKQTKRRKCKEAYASYVKTVLATTEAALKFNALLYENRAKRTLNCIVWPDLEIYSMIGDAMPSIRVSLTPLFVWRLLLFLMERSPSREAGLMLQESCNNLGPTQVCVRTKIRLYFLIKFFLWQIQFN